MPRLFTPQLKNKGTQAQRQRPSSPGRNRSVLDTKQEVEMKTSEGQDQVSETGGSGREGLSGGCRRVLGSQQKAEIRMEAERLGGGRWSSSRWRRRTELERSAGAEPPGRTVATDSGDCFLKSGAAGNERN